MLLPPTDPTAPQDLYLWALGILTTIVGTLMLIILSRVLKQGDDTNQKVTTQGSTLARMEQSVSTLDGRVSDLHQWKNEQMAKEARLAADEILRLRSKLEDRTNERGKDSRDGAA